MYDIQEEDLDGFTEHPHFLVSLETSSLQTQLPIIELLKDFMSGKALYRNLMGILQVGVNSIISERLSKTYGKILEKAVQLSLEILLLVFEKDLLVSDVWRPLYQVLGCSCDASELYEKNRCSSYMQLYQLFVTKFRYFINLYIQSHKRKLHKIFVKFKYSYLELDPHSIFLIHN
jgi:hypothetical protein